MCTENTKCIPSIYEKHTSIYKKLNRQDLRDGRTGYGRKLNLMVMAHLAAIVTQPPIISRSHTVLVRLHTASHFRGCLVDGSKVMLALSIGHDNISLSLTVLVHYTLRALTTPHLHG